MNDAPDATELIRRARGGTDDALGQLLARYGNYLGLLARVQVGRRLQGKVDPADLVQETFLEAHRHFPAFRGQSEPEVAAWLRQIMAGVLSNQLRRYLGTQGRDIRLERELAGELDRSSHALDRGLADPGPTPSKLAAGRERAVLLADALKGLPADYAEVVALHHVEGLSFPEVAARTGRSLDSVKQVWMRALGKIRRVVEGSL
jgi:RNA polymerase sigma-70 factor, ECF subfamily